MKPSQVSSSSEIADCLPSLCGLSLVLAGERRRADDLIEMSISWLFASPLFLRPEGKLNVRLFSTLHDMYFLGGGGRRSASPSTGGWQESAAIEPFFLTNVLVPPIFGRVFWQLPDYEREVLILQEACDLTCAEIARICNCTEAVIETLGMDARRHLASLFYPEAPFATQGAFHLVG